MDKRHPLVLDDWLYRLFFYGSGRTENFRMYDCNDIACNTVVCCKRIMDVPGIDKQCVALFQVDDCSFNHVCHLSAFD